MNLMKNEALKYLILLFFSGSLSINAQNPIQVAGTATITATTSGDWTSPTTWGGTVPMTDDRVLTVVPDRDDTLTTERYDHWLAAVIEQGSEVIEQFGSATPPAQVLTV